MNIREHKPADIPAISRLYYNTVRLINSRDYGAEQILAWAPHIEPDSFWEERFRNYTVFVAEDAGEIAGFTEFEATGHIDCFYVHHLWQRRGVGSRLLERIETLARQNTVRALYADVSVTARPFFERMGFLVTREQTKHYRGYLFRQFVMEKPLS
jgi:putative acetyltransferase